MIDMRSDPKLSAFDKSKKVPFSNLGYISEITEFLFVMASESVSTKSCLRVPNIRLALEPTLPYGVQDGWGGLADHVAARTAFGIHHSPMFLQIPNLCV